jgi:type II secretory pathway component GspD/PulD (secretin)
LVKSLLGADTDAWIRRELIIFIRPTVLENPSKASTFTEKSLDNISETKAVREFLDTSSTGDIYLEGSKFEEDEPRETKGSIWPRFLRR